MARDSNESARAAFAKAVRRAHQRTGCTLETTAERSGVSKASWSATMNGKTFPERTWGRMSAFFSAEGLGATVVDLDELYKAADDERKKPRKPSRPKTGPRMRRTFLSGLEHITAFELPLVDRLDSGIFPADLHSARAKPQNITFLVGEGGLGKSVLLKQLADRLATAKEGAVVGVACNRVDASADLTTVGAADVALARAAGAPDPAKGLTGLVRRLRQEHGSVHLLIDTIDLIAFDRTAGPLCLLLRHLSNDAQLFVTCRKQEYEHLLDPDAASRWNGPTELSPYQMPKLTGDEIVQWAGRYVRRLDRTEVQRERFLELLEDGVKARTFKQVCVVPLRLALACALYSEDEILPSDLTITGLYEAYWERRVFRDQEGKRTSEAERQEASAFALAEQILRDSGDRLSLSVKVNGTEHGKGLKLLESEGVVRSQAGRNEFFHQSFTEFAIAKLLADRGEPEQLEQLRGDLDDSTSHWWPVAHHLLLQRKVAPVRYQDLLDAVPLLTGEGPQIHVLSSQARSLPDRLDTVAKAVKRSSRAHLHSLIHLFAEAPPACAEAALKISVEALKDCESRAITGIAQTIGVLLPRLESISPVAYLSMTLDRIERRSAELPNDLRTDLLAHLIRPVCEKAFGTALLKLLCNHYDRLGSSAQMVMLRSALRHRDSTPDLIETLVEPMLATPRPQKLDEGEYVELLRWCWEHEATRSSQGWDTWRELLDARLPDRWDSAQIRLAVKLCGDPGIRRDLLEERLSESQPEFPRRWVDVALFVAEDDPKTVHEILKSRAWPVGRKAVGNAAALGEQIAKHLDEFERQALITALRPLADIDARRIWPTLVVLAGSDVGLHDDLLTDFLEYDRKRSSGAKADRAWRSDRVSPINTWLNDAPAEFLLKRRTIFRELLLAAGKKFTQRRAHFEGRIAVLDGDARDWLTEQVLREPSVKAAYKGVQAAIAPIEQGDIAMGPELCGWMAPLLRSSRAEVVVKLARLLADVDLTPEALLITPATGSLKTVAAGGRLIDALLAIAVERLRAALERREKSDVVQELTALVSRMGEHAGLAEDVVRAILVAISRPFAAAPSNVREPVPDEEQPDLGAAFNRWCEVVLKLALPGMPLPEVRSNVQAVLVGWDGCGFGTTSNRSAAADVIYSLLEQSSEFKTWLEDELWPGAGWGTQKAIAEAAVKYDRRISGHLALTLSHADCPHDIKMWIRSKSQP